ncbi:MAG: hypothetical protein JWQ55_3188 [Rhodopila sp.]|nr:hypothetical protein [Rhodopila sp.]
MASLGVFVQRLFAMHRVYQRHHCGNLVRGGYAAVRHHRLQHRRWIGKPRRFDQDPVILRCPSLAPSEQLRQRPCQIALNRATQTSRIQCQDLVIAAGDQLVIKSNFPEFIDDNSCPPEPWITQDSADKGRFATSQEAGDDGDRDQAFGTADAGLARSRYCAPRPCNGAAVRFDPDDSVVCGPPGVDILQTTLPVSASIRCI